MAEYVTERLIEEIASNLGIKTTQVNATLELLEEGGTIPFIARYRKEATRTDVWWTASWYVW